MQFTGERFVPEVGGEIRQEHLHRYVFAAAMAQGKRVLDAACGEGYGSAWLARHARSVVGVDIDAASIEHARATYGSRRVRFEQADVTALPLPDDSIDLVVSFETLEHLAPQEAMLAEFRRVLRPGGHILISTPNRVVYSEESGQVNPYHVKELDRQEFVALLQRHFERVQLFGQRFATASAIYPLADGAATGPAPQVLQHQADNVVEPGMAPLQSPTYFIALAGDGLASGSTASLMLSGVDDLYRQFLHVARWASGVDDEFKTAQAGWAATAAGMRDQIARRQERCESLERQLESERTALQQQAEAAREQGAAAAQALEDAGRRLAALEGELHLQRQQHAVALQAQQALAGQHRDENERLLADAQSLQARLALETDARAALRRRVAARLRDGRRAARALHAELQLQRRQAAAHTAALQAEHVAELQRLRHEAAVAVDNAARLAAQQRAAERAASDERTAALLDLNRRLEHEAAQRESAQAAAHAQAVQALEARIAELQAAAAGQAAAARAQLDQAAADREQAAQAGAARTAELQARHEASLRDAGVALAQQRDEAARALAAAQAAAAQALAEERHQHAAREARLQQQLQRAEDELRGQVMLLQRRVDEAESALQRALEDARQERGRWHDAAQAAQAADREEAGRREERVAQRTQLTVETLRADLQALEAERAQERTAWERRLADWQLAAQAREREWLGALRQHRAQHAELPRAPLPRVHGTEAPQAAWPARQPRRTAPQAGGTSGHASASITTAQDPRMLPTLPPPPVKSLDDLIGLDDADFIRAAYLVLLGRPADEAGQSHYLRALAAGRARVLVLADLRNSPEGRRRAVTLPGLEAALRRARLSRLPLIGRAFPLLEPPADAVVRRDLAQLSGQVERIDDTVHDCLAELQHALQVGIQGLAQHAVQADARIDARLSQIEHALGDALQGELRLLSRQALDNDARQHERVQQAEQVLSQRLQRAAQALDTRIGQLQSELDGERQAMLDRLQAGQEAHQAAQGTALASVAEAMAQGRRDALQQAQAAAITQALAQHTWPDETDLWVEVSGWLSATPLEFTQRMFKLMLDREPRAHEIAHFTARLGQGASHWVLVEKMIQSPEFTHQHPRLLSPAAPAPAPAAAPAPVPAPAPAPAPVPAAVAAPAPPVAAFDPGVLPELSCAERPLVSVIIPIYGKLDYTLRCLRSIAAHPPALPMEVIVVDDCSPDDSAAVLARVAGLRLLRNDGNQGFIRSCNRGAAAARGEYLCMLNNDTEVAAGWLDELHRTFELFPGTGLVGSKLLYPDGRLQEAGGVLWRDGSAWNFGHSQDPEQPHLNYTREVDYCSGASIMLPAELYRRLGGFDEHYLPAYCEDSDLAMKVRQAGLRVLYQPLSQVVHYEGVTSGTDTGSGVKAYQVVNSRKLYDRWQPVLSGYQPNGIDVDIAKDRGMRGRVLVVDIVTPTPDQDAGSVTVVNLLTLLREMKLQVTFIPEDNYYRMPQYTAALQRIGVEALYAPYVTSVEQHVAACGARYDAVLLWRPTVVAKHLQTIRRHCPRARVLYHTIDLHYLRMEREAQIRQDEASLDAARRMKQMELDAVRAVDCAIVHSTHELEVLRGEVPVDNVVVFPLIVDVPGSTVPFAERQGLVFVGGYQHVPNVDAAVYFAQEVMPLLRDRLPGVRFHIIGSNAPPQVSGLAGPDVVFEGFVPRLAPLLDRMRVSVAPLRYGAGIKGKIGNSMAMGLPVVASSVAGEGMQLRDGEEVLIADGPQQTAEAICRLYHDEALWRRLQAAGMARIEALSGPQTAYGILRDILGRVGLQVGAPAHALRLYRDRL